MMPSSTAARRLVETLNRIAEADVWPGNSVYMLETLILAFHSTEIVQAFRTADITKPSDVTPEKLEVAYDRLRGQYRQDAVREPVVTFDHYHYIQRTWGVEINRPELIFLLHEAPKLIGIEQFKDLADEAAKSKEYSFPWVMAACRRTGDRRQAGRRRLTRIFDSQTTKDLVDQKEPVPPDAVASMLLTFKTAIRDEEIIRKHEDEGKHGSD